MVNPHKHYISFWKCGSGAKLLSHRTYGRYLKLSKSGKIRVDKVKLRGEAKLDGKYILSTNDFSLPPGEIAQGYKNLSRIEAAFQSMKHVLDIRPVNHTKEQRSILRKFSIKPPPEVLKIL